MYKWIFVSFLNISFYIFVQLSPQMMLFQTFRIWMWKKKKNYSGSRITRLFLSQSLCLSLARCLGSDSKLRKIDSTHSSSKQLPLYPRGTMQPACRTPTAAPWKRRIIRPKKKLHWRATCSAFMSSYCGFHLWFRFLLWFSPSGAASIRFSLQSVFYKDVLYPYFTVQTANVQTPRVGGGSLTNLTGV